jgi:soluble lytic murein transglycosylase-like protein
MRRRIVFRYFRLVSVLALGAGVWLLAAPLDSAAPDQVTPPPSGAQLSLDLALVEWLTNSWNSRQTHYSAQISSVAVAHTTRAFELFPRNAQPTPRKALSVPFAAAIHTAAERYRLDSQLLAAIVEAESGFDARVVSPAGALGLMQVMPDIAGEHGGDPFDPAVNLDVGARYFSRLLQQFDGNLEMALAAYNAGPNTVQRYGRVPPYRETQAFVRKVLSIYGTRVETEPSDVLAAQALGEPQLRSLLR